MENATHDTSLLLGLGNESEYQRNAGLLRARLDAAATPEDKAKILAAATDSRTAQEVYNGMSSFGKRELETQTINSDLKDMIKKMRGKFTEGNAEDAQKLEDEINKDVVKKIEKEEDTAKQLTEFNNLNNELKDRFTDKSTNTLDVTKYQKELEKTYKAMSDSFRARLEVNAERMGDGAKQTLEDIRKKLEERTGEGKFTDEFNKQRSRVAEMSVKKSLDTLKDPGSSAQAKGDAQREIGKSIKNYNKKAMDDLSGDDLENANIVQGFDEENLKKLRGRPKNNALSPTEWQFIHNNVTDPAAKGYAALQAQKIQKNNPAGPQIQNAAQQANNPNQP